MSLYSRPRRHVGPTRRRCAPPPPPLSDRLGEPLTVATTDDDGRIAQLGDDLPVGVYRLHFDTGSYFAALDVPTFYPEVIVAFEITDAEANTTSRCCFRPYAYSTYRGS